MSVEHIGKGYVKICVSEEELERCNDYAFGWV